MASKVYVAGCEILPIDTRTWMQVLSTKLAEAEVYITADSGTWDRKDVQWITTNGAVFMLITYDV